MTDTTKGNSSVRRRQQNEQHDASRLWICMSRSNIELHRLQHRFSIVSCLRVVRYGRLASHRPRWSCGSRGGFGSGRSGCCWTRSTRHGRGGFARTPYSWTWGSAASRHDRCRASCLCQCLVLCAVFLGMGHASVLDPQCVCYDRSGLIRMSSRVLLWLDLFITGLIRG